jgi:hypothetical protein
MSNQHKQAEITELDRLAKEGKLWSIEVLYEHRKETCRLAYYNKTNEEIMRIREAIFRAGFVIPVKDPQGQPVKGSYQIIPPLDILEVFLHRQTEYFRGV